MSAEAAHQPEVEPNAETGKLFEVPRVKVVIDEADPSVLKLSFSGSIDLERSQASAVAAVRCLCSGDVHGDLEVRGLAVLEPVGTSSSTKATSTRSCRRSRLSLPTSRSRRAPPARALEGANSTSRSTPLQSEGAA